MGFPAPGITVPTFSQWPSIYFQGITFGEAPFSLKGGSGQGLQGFASMAPVRSGDTSAPRFPGQYVGLDLPDGRDPTFTFDIGPPFGAYVDMVGAVDALRYALTPPGTTENPLFIQVSEDSPMLVALARPRKADIDIDLAYILGNLAEDIPIQFHATDPTWYAAGTLDPSVGVPTPLGGFTFNLPFNFGFGGGVEFGAITATNYGNVPVYPIVVFTGPCTYPTLTNASLAGNPYVQFGMSLLSGDTLIVDFDPKYPSAMYFASGTTQGADRMYTLQQGSQWWSLIPGENDLQFTSLDSAPVAGMVTVDYPPGAYSSVN